MRAVGEPAERLSEDPLRALRYIGQAAQFGYVVEPSTLQSIRDNVSNLDFVSRERIDDEIMKRLAKSPPEKYFQLLHDSGLLVYLFPEFGTADTQFHDNRGSHHGESVIEHTYEVLARLDPNASVELKLTALLHDIGKTPEMSQHTDGKHQFIGHDEEGAKIIEKDLMNLRFPNDTTKYVSALVRNHMRLNYATRTEKPERQLAELVLDLKEDYPLLSDLVTLSEADQNKPQPEIRGILSRWQSSPQGVRGEDVLALPKIEYRGEEYDFPAPLRGKLLRQMRRLQMYQGKSDEELDRVLYGEAKNLALPFIEAEYKKKHKDALMAYEGKGAVQNAQENV